MSSRLSTRGFGRAGGNLLRIVVLGASIWTLALARGHAPLWLLAVAVAGSLAALYAMDRKSGRFGLWAAYLVGFILFALLRSGADEFGIPVKAGYAVNGDSTLFGGVMPQEWLQRHLYNPSRTSLLDIAVVVVVFSYFVVPHVVALVAWRRDHDLFSRYCPAVLLTVYTGLLVSALVPTAPPWLASRFTDAPAVSRVTANVLGWNPEDVRPESGGSGLNPVAAMPSLHFAMTTLIVIALWRHRWLRIGAILYAAAMGFALIYGGEHYAVDELAGAVTAVAAWIAVNRLLDFRTSRIRASVTTAPAVLPVSSTK
jgi:membrane-associated phospholipid phosphatase